MIEGSFTPAILRSSSFGVTRTPVEVHLKLLGSCPGLDGGSGGYPGGPGGPDGLGGLGGAAMTVAASVRSMLDHFMVSVQGA